MKANWTIALMCAATIAMVACQDKNQPSASGSGSSDNTNPTDTTTTPTDPTDPTDSTYVSPISIRDKSIADWEKLDQSKVAIAKVTGDPLYTALKEIRVYADNVYINFLLKYDPEEFTVASEGDFLHIYMNADNNDETGGYWDQFDGPNQGNTDLMFEGVLWDAEGNTFSYSPTVSAWAGETNGEGWLWEVLPSASTIAGSQIVEDGIIEGRLIKQYIPWADWKDAFEIGFDIQQNAESVGLLPQADTPDGEHIGRAKKLLVTFDK